MISLLCDSNAHNACNSHIKQSVTLVTATTFTLFLCDGKQPKKFLGLSTSKVERKGNS